jgi:ferredoxin
VTLVTDEEAPQYVDALNQQMTLAQTILSGLGYDGRHLTLVHARNAAELEIALHAIEPAASASQTATFHVAADKRNTLDFAISHLKKHAPAEVTEIALPPNAPYGTVKLNTDRCTLCMACVGACPESALMDNSDLPQLRFVEANCVQCGLCQKTCPESAITLVPRLLLEEGARQPRVLHTAEPYRCIRCSKPFGTARMIETMLTKLALHGAFAGNIERLKMCSDCRVVDMMENKAETQVAELKRPF